MGADHQARRREIRPRPLSVPAPSRVVGVLPDVPAIDKVFDYAVPPELDDQVRVGTMVRVELHGRRVGGWVVEDDRQPPPALQLRPIARVTGWGPPPAVLELAEWAAWRWAGRRASILASASPATAVKSLPRPQGAAPAPAVTVVDPELGELVGAALAAPAASLLRLPPATDVLPVVLAAAQRGEALVLYPSTAEAAHAALRLRRAGVAVACLPRDWAAARAGGVTAVGARAAAWAPLPKLASVVVVDGHDDGYREERAPTWHARDVAVARAERAGVPAVVVSPCPDLVMASSLRPLLVSRSRERAGWPALDVIDRRSDDPRTGLLSERLAAALRAHRRLVCVLNRKGRARLLACAGCGELVRCEHCQAAVEEGEASLRCSRCKAERPAVCAECGSGRLKALRKGVSRIREELEALAGRRVGEVTAETAELPPEDILVGTEAVLHRVTATDVVVFLDFDQELTAPRFRAPEQALALLARAARLVGGRGSGGRVLVQTRLPRHEVLAAALHGDPGRVATVEAALRAELGFPPYRALALVSGPAAPELVERVRGVETLGPDNGRWLLRADTHTELADALAAAGRPPGRLRVEVDPLRI
ncbi:MAG: hypothetical protein KY439_03305 [Actinobacteria bacterium]|nr:hypothetical protein [Actinomycetota bacterium]